jgi:hypothetical protein
VVIEKGQLNLLPIGLRDEGVLLSFFLTYL